ncbi:TraR/DksA family transcriptional regulator [Candidatus Pelagisphaera phototrophica]
MYGICAKSGNPIPNDRLAAVPYATRCVGCAF